MMNNSKNYWDKTLNDLGQNFCTCDCLIVEEESEINEEINLHNNKIDNLIKDKRKIKESEMIGKKNIIIFI